MPVSKANQRAVNKYVKENYDRINVTFPKGTKERIKVIAASKGESVNSFIQRAVLCAMEEEPSEPAQKPEAKRIEQPKKRISVENIELPDGYVKIEIPALNGGTEIVVATVEDSIHLAGEETRIRGYFADDSKKTLAALQLQSLYKRLRADSEEHVKRICSADERTEAHRGAKIEGE